MKTWLLRLPITSPLKAGETLHLATELFVPKTIADPACLLVCLPGGGMSRGYYDLVPADGDDSFSFARQMAAHGYLVATVDHLGVGDSDRPVDSYSLTAEVIAAADAAVTAALLAGLRDGSLLMELPPLPGLRSIGVGHSMGAMMTILQQADYRQHVGIAVLGFSTRGLPEYLGHAVEKGTQALRAETASCARKMFGGVDYPEIPPNPQASRIFEGSKADPRAVQAIKAARAPLLPVGAFHSMIPGNVAAEAARIAVPVFLGIGERDMVGDPAAVPAAFEAAPSVEMYVQPGAGHSHFLFASRHELFDRLTGWARQFT